MSGAVTRILSLGRTYDGSAGSSGAISNDAEDYSDITFWLNFENAQSDPDTGDYTMGASECSVGDTTGTTASLGQMSTAAAIIGSYGYETVSSNDYITFSVSSNDIVSGTAGRIGFWYYWKSGAFVDTHHLLKVYQDADNYMFLRTETTGEGELQFRWRSGGSNEIDVTTSTANLVEETAYFFEISWDTVNDNTYVYINGVAVVTDESTNITAISPSSLIITDDDGTGFNVYVDNLMISDDPTRDFYGGGTGLCVETSAPGGACGG